MMFYKLLNFSIDRLACFYDYVVKRTASMYPRAASLTLASASAKESPKDDTWFNSGITAVTFLLFLSISYSILYANSRFFILHTDYTSKLKTSMAVSNLTYILHSLIKWAQYENTLKLSGS